MQRVTMNHCVAASSCHGMIFCHLMMVILRECGQHLKMYCIMKSICLFRRSNVLQHGIRVHGPVLYVCMQLRNKIAKKHRLWTRYIETRDQNILSKYKSMRNIVRRETRKLHRLELLAIASQCKKIL